MGRKVSRSVSDVEDRVVMLCEDVPSEASSWDSGRGSQSSGARSSSEELGHAYRSHSFHGREEQSMKRSPQPTKQCSVRVESPPVYAVSTVHPPPRVREMYESEFPHLTE